MQLDAFLTLLATFWKLLDAFKALFGRFLDAFQALFGHVLDAFERFWTLFDACWTLFDAFDVGEAEMGLIYIDHFSFGLF